MKLEKSPFRVWSYVVIIWFLCDSEALFKFTNIKCICYEKSFCELKRCELKVLGRGIVGLFLHAQANQLPINTSSVRKIIRWFLYHYKNLTFPVRSHLVPKI